MAYIGKNLTSNGRHFIERKEGVYLEITTVVKLTENIIVRYIFIKGTYVLITEQYIYIVFMEEMPGKSFRTGQFSAVTSDLHVGND